MNRLLTDEQAAYLSQLYTGTDAPKLHKASTMYVHDLEQRYADRGYTIQRLERLVHERKEQVEDLNHKLFEAMCSRNRADNEKMAADVARVHAELKSLRREITIHRLERKLSRANRKYKSLHRAMHDDTERVRGSLIKAAERLAQSIITPSTVEESAYGAAWPRFADGAPVVIGDCVKGVMCDVHVASIVFRYNCVLLYDSQMFHYVKLDGGERAQRPDGTRLALD